MYKIINLFILIIFFIFFINIFNYYFSNKNIKNINLNRANIEEIIKKKISNIPILDDNTNNIIEFNDSFSLNKENNQKRSFWNLLKIK